MARVRRAVTLPIMTEQQRLLMPAGAISESGVGRAAGLGNQAILTTGTLRLGAPQVLPAGRTISTITIASATQAAVTPTNQWFCLVRSSDLAVLAKTADDLTTAWSTNAVKTLTLAAAFTPVVNELVWLGVLVAAATTPSLQGWSATNATAQLGGNSTTGLTTPGSLGASAVSPTPSAGTFYGYTS